MVTQEFRLGRAFYSWRLLRVPVIGFLLRGCFQSLVPLSFEGEWIEVLIIHVRLDQDR